MYCTISCDKDEKASNCVENKTKTERCIHINLCSCFKVKVVAILQMV